LSWKSSETLQILWNNHSATHNVVLDKAAATGSRWIASQSRWIEIRNNSSMIELGSSGSYSDRVQIHGPTVTSSASETSTIGKPRVRPVNATPAVIAPTAAILAFRPIARRSRQLRSDSP